jgi:tRNA pseudouridine13 synthase
MKVKQQPDDFQVEELTDVAPTTAGPFAFYRLEKAGWTTPDALAAIRRRWKIDLRRLSFGGLKDKHAETVQYLTIHHGPRRDLKHHTVRVRYLGQVSAPYTSNDVRGNRFRVTLRALAPSLREEMEKRLAEVSARGLPNYFDDQRFGSVSGPGGEFIARHLVHGRFEEALKLALAAPYAFDKPALKQEKETLRKHWGDWETCKQTLPRGHARSLVDYLRTHPHDFKGAVTRLRPELRGLYLSAYQSHLWNRILARWLRDHARPDQVREVRLRLGLVPFPTELDPGVWQALTELSLPLPSSRWKPEANDARREVVEAVLAEDGLTLQQMQVRGVRELFFSRGERSAWCRPGGLQWEWGDNERGSGLQVRMTFELPRGSYATLIVKAIADAQMK